MWPLLFTSQSAAGVTAVSSRVQVELVEAVLSLWSSQVSAASSTPATSNESSLVLFWGHRKQKKKGNRNPG